MCDARVMLESMCQLYDSLKSEDPSENVDTSAKKNTERVIKEIEFSSAQDIRWGITVLASGLWHCCGLRAWSSRSWAARTSCG